MHYSVQVLNEFIAASRHPDKLNLSRERERRWLEGWLLRPVGSLTSRTFLSALSLHQRYQVSHWDALILAAAKEANCETLYTEDLQNGQIYDGITAVDPFA